MALVITDYFLVQLDAETGNRIDPILQKLKDGWEPWGNPFCSQNWIYQAMVKYGETPKQNVPVSIGEAMSNA